MRISFVRVAAQASVCCSCRSRVMLMSSLQSRGLSNQFTNTSSNPHSSVDISSSENSELPSDTAINKKKGRIRQHVNPLSAVLSRPIELPSDWVSAAFERPKELPFVVDIGCAKGGWVLSMAAQNTQQFNYLGLEIREPYVELAQVRKEKLSLSNAHFLFCNANANLSRILSDLRLSGSIAFLCVQFPDPLFKKRQKKRRVLTDEVLWTMARCCDSSTKLFVQSDVSHVLEETIEAMDRTGLFVDAEGYNRTQLSANPSPMQCKTEREVSCLARGLPIYRMMFRARTLAVA